jgi:hypothetical protein
MEASLISLLSVSPEDKYYGVALVKVRNLSKT